MSYNLDIRTLQMAYEYTHGKTLQQIGDSYGLTRERVRQIIKKTGIKKDQGGRSIRTLINIRYQKKKKDEIHPVYGCKKSEAIVLNGGQNVSCRGTPAHRYVEHRRNAIYRQIGWEITFPQWMKIWQDSGKWELRGRGQGYCMARIGDTGPYHPDNVEIKTCGENFSDSYYKHPWHVRFDGRIKKTHCLRGHLSTRESRYPNGSCKQCCAIRFRERKNRFHSKTLGSGDTVKADIHG